MDQNLNKLPYSMHGFSDSIDGFNFDDATTMPIFNQFAELSKEFESLANPSNFNFMDVPIQLPDPDSGSFPQSSTVSSEVDSPNDNDSDVVLKYLNQILVEENIDEKPSMFHDPLALQAAEKSFYEVLGQKYPHSPYYNPLYIDQNVESPDSFFRSSSEYSANGSTSASNSTDTHWILDSTEQKLSVMQSHPTDYSVQSTLQMNSENSSLSVSSFSKNINGIVDPFAGSPLLSNIFSDSESILQFKRGMEEASKFLPKVSSLVIDLDKYNLPSEKKEVTPETVSKAEKVERDYSPNSSRGRKHHWVDGDFEEERISKQSAVYVDESELSEMFDKVLLFSEGKGGPGCCVNDASQCEESNALQQNGQHYELNGGKTRSKKQDNQQEAVDLRTLLISWAQSIAADDRRTATEQLKQIRQHSSPTGDASQRLAHVFANGLEARLAGTGNQIPAALAHQRISAVEKLKAYQLYLSASPFKKISIYFANKMIFNAASKATTLHIVDFGILYGFQWPILIQFLSSRPGGPPNLRITGIELPLPGFRPDERLQETGRRLANYCERFEVPFEYNAIATQHWETIKLEDIKIKSDEVVAVNCLFRFKNLLDETVNVDSPRDAVLNLIRKMNPDIFVHAVVNGSYNAPFFVSRFREALFHYSALFDMFDTTISHEDPQRLDFEKEFYGRESLNVIACEGSERVERPETYKQWQVRNKRAGFDLLPLDPELMKKLRYKVQSGYHKDFVFDENGHWMLQGWKGRILYAASCWVSA